MSPSDCTGLILAGGHSRRFGEDKARFEIGGQAMIERVVEAVAAVVQPVLVSVGDEDKPFAGVRNVGYVTDHYKDAGPLAGLHAGWQVTETPWLLAVACDMPFITAEVLHSLLARRTPQTDAVVARTPDGRWHPLCACYHARTLPVVTKQLEQGSRTLHVLLECLPHVRFADLPAAPLRNVNRPADLHFGNEEKRTSNL